MCMDQMTKQIAKKAQFVHIPAQGFGEKPTIEGLKQKQTFMPVIISLLLLCCFSALTAASQPVKIMPLGDSITRGWYGSPNSHGYRKPLFDKLINAGCNFDFVGSQTDGNFPDPQHEGRDGWHADTTGTSDILGQVYNWLTANPADIVLLHIGTNDISYGGQNANEVNSILNEIDRFSTGIKVILALIVDRVPHSPATTQFNINVNNMAQNRIAAGDDILIVNMESALNYATDMADSVHPNDAGYAKMANVWYNALDSLLNPPLITSAPITDVTVSQPYSYDVNADGFPKPTYALTTYPDGMTIDHNTGLIEWLPATAGDFNVTVKAGNGQMPDANQSFVITVDEPVFAISGHVLETDGNTPVEGVLIQTDDNDINSMTDANGYYELWVDYGRSSIVTPQKEGYVFEPNSAYVNVTRDYNDVNYTATLTTFVISGYVLEPNHIAPISDVNVSAQNGGGPWTSKHGGGSSLTDVNGYYEVWVDYNWSGTVTSGKIRYSLGPSSRYYKDVNENWTADQDYTGTLLTLRITGCIRNECNAPIKGVLVSADNGGDQSTTDANGCYEVWVSDNWSGTVTLSKAHYTFDPPNREYTDVLKDKTGQDYSAHNICDLDCDGSIGYGDVAIIHENWLQTGPNVAGDIHKDEANTVDSLDFADFADVWQEVNK